MCRVQRELRMEWALDYIIAVIMDCRIVLLDGGVGWGASRAHYSQGFGSC